MQNGRFGNNGNRENLPLVKRGINFWRGRNPANISSHGQGLTKDEIEWLRDIVANYDKTGKADRFIMYDNELAGGKRSDKSPDFSLRRFARPGEEGYTERAAQPAQATEQDAI